MRRLRLFSEYLRASASACSAIVPQIRDSGQLVAPPVLISLPEEVVGFACSGRDRATTGGASLCGLVSSPFFFRFFFLFSWFRIDG